MYCECLWSSTRAIGTQRTVRKRDFKEVCFRQQEPPNFRNHAYMYLITILIQWLVELFGSGESFDRLMRRHDTARAGTIFQCHSNSAYCLGAGRNKVNIVLLGLKCLLGQCPAHAVALLYCRGFLDVKPYRLDFTAETARCSTNSSPPWPHAWG
jgi:hypothetical protein